jgi:hypothetical protein
MRWREWVVKLRYSFGSAHPLVANQPSEVLDPMEYWWGLTRAFPRQARMDSNALDDNVLAIRVHHVHAFNCH